MSASIDIHRQFARFFEDRSVEPFLYEVSRMLTEGHICIDPALIDPEGLKEAGYASVPPLEELLASDLISDGQKRTPFVYLNSKLYMQRYFHYESLILNRISAFNDYEADKKILRLETLLSLKETVAELFAGTSENSLSVNWQWLAAITAVLHDFSIITGGPGTGKTTTVAKVLSLLLHMNQDLRIALCAPTGKAAARMAESLRLASAESEPFIKKAFESLMPSTIHRLLGTILRRPYFKHNHEQPLKVDVVVVDEASMIDVGLMAKLMDAIGEGTKMILLGDKDQLASVEAGSLFGDLCKALPAINCFSGDFLSEIRPLLPSGRVLPEPYSGSHSTHLLFEHIVELQYSHRFSGQMGIGRFSKAILNNDPAIITSFFTNQDEQVLVDGEYDPAIFASFVLGYKEFMEEPDIRLALKAINRLRVLCAVRETSVGVEAINRKIEQLLRQKGGLRTSERFYENRLIMVTSNNSQLNLFNGDIGIVRRDEAGVMRAWFEAADGSIKSVLPGFIGSVETAFAMTIHKSQGSEFSKVLILLPEKLQATKMLTRELIYTAVTRAREKVIIQGGQEVLLAAASMGIHRGSGIIGRLEEHV